MNNAQLWEAIRELQGISQVQRRELDELRERVTKLERDEQWRYEQDQAISAHLNGMTYP
jgi:hypothetical protein